MAVVVTAADRASFSRRRGPDLDRAVRDALAVYYFPGMWDWDRAVRLPLVGQELDRALNRQRHNNEDDEQAWQDARTQGHALLARYVNWAPNADRFAPVLVETDFEVDVLDPHQPQAALVTHDGEIIRYRGRVDLLAVDEHDAYWIVRHRVVGAEWPPTEQLIADDEALAACWAWEQFYLGMAITGTVYNELQIQAGPLKTPRWPRLRERRTNAVRQHEPSGGGRSIPQHRRMYAQAREPRKADPIQQVTKDNVRRTWLRRTPAEIQQAGRRLGLDLAEMTRDDLDRYRNRPPEPLQEGRLGGRAWGLGRGAAPPRFRGPPPA